MLKELDREAVISSNSHRGRTKSGEISRLHVSLPESLLEKLKEIQNETHASSTTEVIKNALIVYSALLEEHKQGRDVFTQSKDGSSSHKMAIFMSI